MVRAKTSNAPPPPPPAPTPPEDLPTYHARSTCRYTGERLGAVHVVCGDPESALAVQSLFEVVTRSMLSNAPLHGGRIALHILSDPARKAAWCVWRLSATGQFCS